jgi:lipopolysaccharide export system protein LptC
MTARTGKDETSERSAPQRGRDERSRDAAFRRAVSHSRKVRVLKLALPVAAIVIAGSFAAYSYISVPGTVSFDVSESAYSDGKLVMANPKLEGFTKDNKPYRMSATRALQHADNSSVIDLEGIDARLPFSGENFATIGADHGVFNYDQRTLDISSPITVSTTDGMTATLQSAYVDMIQGLLNTDKPVSINLAGVSLSADAMRVTENGRVLVFESRVRLELKPDRFKSAKDEAAKTSAQN